MKRKRNRTKIATLVIVLLVSSFSYSQGQKLDPYQFFPANIGDRWEYTMAGPGAGWTIIRDSIDLKDSSRFIFFTYPPTFMGADYRIDRKYNVFMSPQFSNRHVFKLDAKVGDTWMVLAGPPRYEARVREINQGIVFGKVTTIMTIDLFLLTRGDTVITEYSMLQYWEKLAYGFGLISREDGATQPMLLRGARINGITYGTVDVEEEPKMVPSEFVLYQNYPNPFNPSTTISFSIPEYSHVVIKVIDILGREIQEIANDYFSPGKHQTIFDARNLSSGIYFYQLITNKTTRTMKMILQK